MASKEGKRKSASIKGGPSGSPTKKKKSTKGKRRGGVLSVLEGWWRVDIENSDFQSFLGGDLSVRRTGFPTVLQHDTFLLPQHCGGPIVDLDGRVVGINIARAERIASYALPAKEIQPWIEQYVNDIQEVAQRR